MDQDNQEENNSKSQSQSLQVKNIMNIWKRKY